MRVFQRCTTPPAVSWDSRSPMKALGLVARPVIAFRGDAGGMFAMQLELGWPNIAQQRQSASEYVDAWFTYDDFIKPDIVYPLRLDDVVGLHPVAVVSRITTEELWKTCGVEVFLESDRGTVTVIFRGLPYRTRLPSLVMTDLRESRTMRPNDK